jgi:hypothetical protein
MLESIFQSTRSNAISSAVHVNPAGIQMRSFATDSAIRLGGFAQRLIIVRHSPVFDYNLNNS